MNRTVPAVFIPTAVFGKSYILSVLAEGFSGRCSASYWAMTSRFDAVRARWWLQTEFLWDMTLCRWVSGYRRFVVEGSNGRGRTELQLDICAFLRYYAALSGVQGLRLLDP
jgi:hypothetical protein